MASSKFSDPVFYARARDLNRKYCEICGNSWDKKSFKRANLHKIKKDSFQETAVEWSKREHKFNLVFTTVNWTATSDMYSCTSCYSAFFKDDYLQDQKMKVDVPALVESTSSSPLKTPIIKPKASVPTRSSQRQKLAYSTDRDSEKNRACIICYRPKRDKKGRPVPRNIDHITK